jgi:VWFA-related protein
MRRCAPLAVLLAAASAVAAARPQAPQTQQPAAQQPPVFRSMVEGVSVSVSVRKGNQPVQGLTADDFQLLDNNVPQRIEALSVETLPIDVTLLLDLSRSVAGLRLERLKRSVVETTQLLDPTDRLRLIGVQQVVHQIFPFEPGGSTPPIDNLVAQGGTALYDALSAAMMRAAEPDRRQLIIAYTDGQDTISFLPFEEAREIAGFADAVVHVVIPLASLKGGSAKATVPDADRLGELAARTGGQLFWVDAAAPITDAFKAAIAQFRTSYVLRYVPKGVPSTGWHELTVRVTSGTYEVHARKGYNAG